MATTLTRTLATALLAAWLLVAAPVNAFAQASEPADHDNLVLGFSPGSVGQGVQAIPAGLGGAIGITGAGAVTTGWGLSAGAVAGIAAGGLLLGVGGYYGYKYYTENHRTHADTVNAGQQVLLKSDNLSHPGIVMLTGVGRQGEDHVWNAKVQMSRTPSGAYDYAVGPHYLGEFFFRFHSGTRCDGSPFSGERFIQETGMGMFTDTITDDMVEWDRDFTSLLNCNYFNPDHNNAFESVDMTTVDEAQLVWRKTSSGKVHAIYFTPDGNPAPMRSVRTEANCFNPSTGITQDATSLSKMYETGPVDGAISSPPTGVTCPDGYIMTDVQALAVPEGGNDGQDYPVFDWEVPPIGKADMQDAESPNADCWKALADPNIADCFINLFVTPANLPTDHPYFNPAEDTPQPCEVGPCTDWEWWADQDHDGDLDEMDADDSPFSCRWGTNPIGADGCGMLVPTFDLGTEGNVSGNNKPDGSAEPDPTLDPGGWKSPEGDPLGEQPIDQPVTQPTTDPGTDPGGEGGEPGTGGGGGTGNGTVTLPPIDVDSPQADGCVWSDVGWNPVSWVLVPVKCALTWAFVPTAAATATWTALRTDLGSKAPFTYFGAIADWLGGLSPGSGCLNLTLNLGAIGGGSVTVINSCGNPDGASAWMMAHRGLFQAIIWITVYPPLAWWAWRTYAPGAQGRA